MKNGFTVNYTLITKKNLSADAVTAYVGINMCRAKLGTRYLVSIGELYYSLFGVDSFSRKKCSKLEDGIRELKDKGILIDVEELNYKVLFMEIDESVAGSKGFWINVNSFDVTRILQAEYQRTRELLRYFILFLGLRDNSGKLKKEYKAKFIMNNLTTIASKTGVNAETAAKYNNILEENEIIYIFRRAVPNEFDPYKKGNVYCLYKDKEVTREYLMLNGYYLKEDEGGKEELRGEHSDILTDKERYNYFNIFFKMMDNGNLPSFKDMKKAILYIKEYNRVVWPIIEKSKESGIPSGYQTFDEAHIEPLIDLAYDDNYTDYPDGFLDRYGYRLSDSIKPRTF